VIIKIKNLCLYLTALMVVGSNICNYFFIQDRDLQWRVAMVSIAAVMFLMALYVWLNESLKRKGISIIVSGWVALYLSFDLVGVLAGYNLHVKGFMVILFITTFLGISHLSIRLWQKYY